MAVLLIVDARAVSGRSSVGAISLHHEPGNRSTIAFLHTFDSVEAAESFISNPELAERVKEGGVTGPPRIRDLRDPLIDRPRGRYARR
jgi:hypothetical protein